MKAIHPRSNCLPSQLHRCQSVKVDAAYDDPAHDDLNQSQSVPSLSPVQNVPSFSAASLQSQHSTLASVEMTTATLPPFSPITEPQFVWSESIDGEKFHAVTCAYAEAIHWRRNLSSVPSGKAGTAFVVAQANLLRAYGEGTAMKSFALRAAMLMPILLQQKPHARSKTKHHIKCLKRCLSHWNAGDIDALMDECCTIQSQFRQPSVHQRTSDEQHMTKDFMSQCKVKAAIQLLDNHSNGGPLSLDDAIQSGIVQTTVRDELIAKHPQGQLPHPETVLCPPLPVQEPHPTLFDRLDGEMIRSVTL